MTIDFRKITLVFVLMGLAIGCDNNSAAPAKPTTPETPNKSEIAKRYLYVASGSCYGGGVALSIGSGTVVRYDLATGLLDRVVIDYNSYQPGDLPNAIADYSTTQLLVAVENTSGRRIDLVNKDGSGITTYIVNSTALNGIIRDMKILSNGSLLVSKSTAIEKFSSGKSRVTQGVNAYIQAPGSACATSTTLMSSMTVLGNGKILYTHAAASPNNKLGLISAAGYASTSDCLSTQSAPTTTALPTASVLHSSGDLLVAYGSATAAGNVVYSYGIDQDANLFSVPIESLNDAAIIYGPSSMIEDSSDHSVYISNALSTFNSVEKFTYDSTTKKLTRIGLTPFISQSVFTRCISSMRIGE